MKNCTSPVRRRVAFAPEAHDQRDVAERGGEREGGVARDDGEDVDRQPHVVAQDGGERIDRGVEDGRVGIGHDQRQDRGGQSRVEEVALAVDRLEDDRKDHRDEGDPDDRLVEIGHRRAARNNDPTNKSPNFKSQPEQHQPPRQRDNQSASSIAPSSIGRSGRRDRSPTPKETAPAPCNCARIAAMQQRDNIAAQVRGGIRPLARVDELNLAMSPSW